MPPQVTILVRVAVQYRIVNAVVEDERPRRHMNPLESHLTRSGSGAPLSQNFMGDDPDAVRARPGWLSGKHP